ncbi:MAG: NAD(P)-dependent alcohol dehydrogenase [Gammaproteobacteria bacterium]|nr:NAD(P)-dependent alcohol dehydrogenase [Gammaproteobacteria bacterium]
MNKPGNETSAWMTAASRQPLTQGRARLNTLGPMDVELRVIACGLCHSDLHLINDDWGISEYPLVPGHEVVGRVVAAGEAVNGLAVGQRVGVGWLCGACLECPSCNAGEDNLCAVPKRTCLANVGGFASRIRVDSRFAHPIPEGLSDLQAAPLLCAGVTVYSPLKRLLPRSGRDVGVVGVGGLGHLALQYASHMGHEVTAIIRGPGKEKDAKAMGASSCLDSTDAAQMAAAEAGFDFLLVTVSADLDWSVYMSLLRANGTLCLVGMPAATIMVPIEFLVGEQKILTGSSIGSRDMTREMLEYSAANEIYPWVIRMPMDRVNEALRILADGEARYRIVLTA